MNKPQDPEAAETVQTTNVPAVDLPRLVRPSSLRRFSPKELDDFQEWRKNRPSPVIEREDVPHIVFPKGSRFISDFPMTHEEIKAVSDLMFAGQKMREASDRLLQVLPAGAWHQFFGDWNLLRISNREPE
jgi:hypothetical protein